ncbi:putative Fe-S protein [Candidatus Desulfarcum epimagneticum]|uniref:Putative Fe-S protein n=1 Tax=uncultured Desulfobacteraceae bacterium TaxID=218296 RepID=A0A484HK06_9BACT|nr:putative Fe-S protein [uncultured Desulfobacteraceae bacterium]
MMSDDMSSRCEKNHLNQINKQIQIFIENLFASSDENRLPDNYGGGQIFAKPLIGVSKGDDYIFEKFKEVVRPDHLTPAEMWTQSGFPWEAGLAARLRALSVAFPFSNQIREAGNNNDGQTPAEIFSIGYNFSKFFLKFFMNETVTFLNQRGFRAMSGVLSEAFNILKPYPFRSNWSEKHIAFAAGLGSFNLQQVLITDMGCNVVLASVITDAPLESTTRESDDPYANCLHFAKKKCGKCIDKCPADAITEKGLDREKCFAHIRLLTHKAEKRSLKKVLKPRKHKIIGGKVETNYPVGCTFCQFGVPCSDKNPTTRLSDDRALNL